MADHSNWNARLRSEAASWVAEGLIDESQREKIVSKYPLGPTTPPPLPAMPGKAKPASAKSLLPTVLIVVAVLLIGVGMILFYAANWRKMSPTVKFIQVIGMIVLSHGGAFLMLFGKRRWVAAGRGLLFLGMLSFGAGMARVVQMYHISAHPARCVLLWAAFVAAMAALMRERLGLYLALGLVLIWDIWERAVYHSPNYPMILAIAALYLLAVRLQCFASRVICVLLAILWFYAVNFYYLAEGRFEESFALFAFLQIPFGIFLISTAIVLREKVESGFAMMVRLIGWLAIYAPLIFLSWPISFRTSLIPGTDATRPFLVEFGVVTVLAAGLVALVRKSGSGTWRFLAIGLGVGILLLFVPLGNPGIFMTIMLAMLLLFHALTLLAEEKIKLQEASAMAFVFAAVSGVVHSFGHFTLVFNDERLLVASGLSGLLFVAVLFFINLLIANRKGDETPYPKVLTVIWIGIATVILYIVSFVPNEQVGILEGEPEWMLPVILLANLAGILSVFSILNLDANRKLMAGALAVTGISIILMFLTASIPMTLLQLILNALLLAIFGLVIAYAVEINSPTLVNLGVAAIVVLVMTRYFDVFWNMLNGSIFFMVTGVVLFAIAGFMEWQRRRWLSRIRSTTEKGAIPS